MPAALSQIALSPTPFSGNSAFQTQCTPTRSDRELGHGPRLAIVHDWCPVFGGAERVLEAICRLFKGEVFTLFDFLTPEIKQAHFPEILFHTSFANQLPMVRHYHRALFFACPFLIEQFDVTDYDGVITSSAAFARGVITRPDQPHVCYVHSPVRYAWDEQFSYLRQGRLGFGPKGLLFRYLLHRLRTWDARTAHGPDLMLANSTYVRQRIRRVYGRDAQVVFPPVPLDGLEFATNKDDYYVIGSFLAPYKRVDLVIKAFNEMPNRRLLVVGKGQQLRDLRSIARSNISFTGFLPREQYIGTIANARGFVFAGCEDFGIALAEAQGCGTPVIAFGRGGASDIVRPVGGAEPPSGILFNRQTVDDVIEAVKHFEAVERLIAPAACRENALRFSIERFNEQMTRAFEFAQEMLKKFPDRLGLIDREWSSA